MGSLMSGWDSPVLCSKTGIYKRNRSLTKDEIEAFWKTKQKTVDKHLKEITTLTDTNNKKASEVDEELMSGTKVIKRSNSLPLKNIRINKVCDDDDDTSIDKLIKKNGWWTRSNWAFLNEPPVIESTSNKYVTQFHVAALAPSKSHTGNVIATN